MRTRHITRIIISAVIICSFLIVALPGTAGGCTNPVVVFRLFNKQTGEHFYTSDVSEKYGLLKTYPDVWQYEGAGYQLDGDQASDPLFRFYNLKNGTHFYTADPVEKDRIKSALVGTYKYEGVSFNVSRDPAAGKCVYRFFNKKSGSHFYTADETEKNNVIAKLGSTYTLEGQAYYLPY